MAINKVELTNEDGSKNTLVDLTGDTVNPEALMEGHTAHNSAGEQITGKAKPGSGGPAVQSDWAVNDPESPAYVKNRPCYVETNVAKELYPKQDTELAFNPDMQSVLALLQMPADYSPTADDTLRVSWDGTDYITKIAVLDAAHNVFAFGNLAAVGQNDTGEPFLGQIATGAFNAIMPLDGQSRTIQVGIDLVETAYTTMPMELLPESVKNVVVYPTNCTKWEQADLDAVSGYLDAGKIVMMPHTIFPGKLVPVLIISGSNVSYLEDDQYKRYNIDSGSIEAFALDLYFFTENVNKIIQKTVSGKENSIEDHLRSIRLQSAYSTKKFDITVDDTGTLKVTEVV